MLMPANLVTGYDHHQIPRVTNLVLVVRHELFRKPPPLSVFGNKLVPIHGDVDGLLHLVGDHRPHECTARVATGRVVDEVPSGDRGHVGELPVRHFIEFGRAGGDRAAIGIFIVPRFLSTRDIRSYSSSSVVIILLAPPVRPSRTDHDPHLPRIVDRHRIFPLKLLIDLVSAVVIRDTTRLGSFCHERADCGNLLVGQAPPRSELGINLGRQASVGPAFFLGSVGDMTGEGS
mmetsp:Transcript_39656/g.95386  ORF Transcript_39656/g.95386 Transcript_39656/m.95386 type:complete len:232 (+) Transcript_39656:243-938(+)